jgi:hypothetical protein
LEYSLADALLDPLGHLAALDTNAIRLDRETMGAGDGIHLPCITVIPSKHERTPGKALALGAHPTYCFDASLPVLRVSYSAGGSAVEYNRVATVQNRYLAREILIYDNRRRVLSAEVEAVTPLDLNDLALRLPDDAHNRSDKLAENEPAMPVEPDPARFPH